MAVAAERVHERRGAAPPRRRRPPTPSREREPQRLRRRARAASASSARAVQARHARGRPVGQEDAERDERREHGRGERQRRELRRAEVADDRGVDQQVQRLGGQRAERGQREAQDLAVVGGSGARRGHSTIRAWSGPSRCSPPLALAACGAQRATPLDGACLSRPARDRARARPRARARDAAVGDAAVAVRRQRAQRRRPAERGRRAHARRRRLAAPAQAGDAAAALRLGYLVGAARRGATRTAGIHAELQRHIERSAARARRQPAPRVAAALARGQRAGEATG